MLDFIQQLVSGIALGCIYGLIALGFVLIYKTTEVVNFAQGELLMLGGFFAFTFIALLGLNYWIGFFLAVICMAAFGAASERFVLRPVLGSPQFSIVMATIGLGFFLRSIAGMIWGTDDLKIDTPFSTGVLRIGDLVLAHDKLSVIVATAILCVVLYLFFTKTQLGTAMRATSENMLAAYYMGIPVKTVVALTWAISAAVAACAGVLLAPITFIHSNVGLVLALKAFPAAVLGGFGSIPGRGRRRHHHRRASRTWPASICAQGLEGRRAAHRAADDAAPETGRPVRPRRRGRKCRASVMRFIFKTDYDQDIRIFKHSGYWYSYSILLLRAGRGAVRARQLPAEPAGVRVHLRDRRRVAADPGRLHRAGLARPRGVPRHRRLHVGLLPAARRAVRDLFSAVPASSPASSACWSASRRCGCRASTSSSPRSRSAPSSRKSWPAGKA